MSGEGVRSTAVVKYSSTKAPAMYDELGKDTNLNITPSNWLRGRFATGDPWVPGYTSSHKEFSSFLMASNFVDLVGKVDVISDGENIKRLLETPYSDEPLSMMMHRVGRSLLIDQFDIYKHLLRHQKEEWRWLVNYIRTNIAQNPDSPDKACVSLVPVAPSREEVQEKLMLSKFLYHSLATQDENERPRSSSGEVDRGEGEGPSRSLLDPLNVDADCQGEAASGFERSVLWTFEDIRMLVGTDVPIFGGGTHPCVSLRLRDMKKPISILTGLDYYLDQLMCNVPEVLMCYIWTVFYVTVMSYTIFRDMKKPISILTGLDYYLDQLMCNVPEVLMCYIWTVFYVTVMSYTIFRDMKKPISILTGLDYYLDQLMCNVPEVLMCYIWTVFYVTVMSYTIFRDMKKPISILTGLDYYLDQLMCNVPEVLMCYIWTVFYVTVMSYTIFRDMKKPISILTGLDYYLDQLMCNVPEVLMCYIWTVFYVTVMSYTIFRDMKKPISILTGLDYYLDQLMCNVPEVLMCYIWTVFYVTVMSYTIFRDMKKPISILTGLDYYLDQLMCNVPEVLMCYIWTVFYVTVMSYTIFRDMKKPISILTGLDYYLDQLMCNVPEVLMCYIWTVFYVTVMSYTIFRDMKKPISILTGLDYYLDQLMCNVPEVLMCYHLDGIVQKYELIATEELPSATESPGFEPSVVRDVAKNVLSFLKGNSTKEGHTYWLFKGKGDDVVKLYDLTGLCADYMTEEDSNPFTLPVALLMYRVAKNIVEKSRSNPRKTANTVYRLLMDCLELLDKDKYPQIVGSVEYLLSNVYLNIGVAGSGPTTEDDDGMDDFDQTDWFPYEQKPTSSSSDQSVSMVTMDVLTDSNAALLDKEASPQVQPTSIPGSTNLEDCCLQMLDHIHRGLECVSVDQPESPRDQSEPTAAMPAQPIPLKYEPLKMNLPLCIRQPRQSAWQRDLNCLLLLKAFKAYHLLAECAFKLNLFGKAMRHIKHAFLAYNCCKHQFRSNGDVELTAVMQECESRLDDLLSDLLVLCGDVHCHVSLEDARWMPRHRADLAKATWQDRQIASRASLLLKPNGTDSEFSDLCCLSDSIQDNLQLANKCYDTALKELNRVLKATGQTNEEDDALLLFDGIKIMKRIGNVKNQLGQYHLRLAMEILQDADAEPVTEEELKKRRERREAYWRRAYACYQEGIDVFSKVHDKVNLALLFANCGQLMRAYAHFNRDATKFSVEERQYMHKALELYQTALDTLTPKGDKIVMVESIIWELATIYFTIGSSFQTRPPHTEMDIEDIEKQISENMHKAIEMVESIDSPENDRHAVFVDRCALIHHKLAGMYHHAFMLKDGIDKSSERRQKQTKTLAELHYRKAAELYKEILVLQDGIDKSSERRQKQMKTLAELHYRKAAELYKEILVLQDGIDKSSERRQKQMKTLAELHYRKAAELYKEILVLQDGIDKSSERRQKQMKTLAELHYRKAAELYKEILVLQDGIDKSSERRQKQMKTLAELHYRKAAELYKEILVLQDGIDKSSERRQKQMKTLAELHYRKAAELYKEILVFTHEDGIDKSSERRQKQMKTLAELHYRKAAELYKEILVLQDGIDKSSERRQKQMKTLAELHYRKAAGLYKEILVLQDGIDKSSERRQKQMKTLAELHYRKAAELYKEILVLQDGIDKSSERRQKQMKTLAELHYRKAAELYKEILVFTHEDGIDKSSERRQKQMKTLAELHYRKAAELYKEILAEACLKYLRVQLERVAIPESAAEGASDPLVKLKLLQQAYTILQDSACAFFFVRGFFSKRMTKAEYARSLEEASELASDSMDSSLPNGVQKLNERTKEKEEENVEEELAELRAEVTKLSGIILERLQIATKNMLQLLKTRKGHEAEARCKQAYGATILVKKPNSAEEWPAIIETLLQKLRSLDLSSVVL